MDGFETVEKLKALEQRMPPAPFSVKKIRLNEMEGDSWLHDAEGEILELTLDEIADLRNAAPLLLDIAGQIQPDDAERFGELRDIIEEMREGESCQVCEEMLVGYREMIIRYQKMAERMHE